ncbi:hypothetical protein [Changpingibacter yushuensis]|uniref:hypothetical protein n=1 Tax=Changpingibacter yushuensis TaxID=2758440 RepID=UPI00165E4E6C|nr:hypothetical protein [Changpingibacter yushuensis]
MRVARSEVSDLVLAVCAAEEMVPFRVIHDGKDGAGNWDQLLEAVIVLGPFLAEYLDLLALLHVERFA